MAPPDEAPTTSETSPHGPARPPDGRLFVAHRIVLPLQDFLRTEGASGAVLLGAALVALVWANSPWRASHGRLMATEMTIRIGSFSLGGDLRHWIDDGLMTLFFFVVGLEVKRELLEGRLSSFRRAFLPAAAALGGMVAPALFYLALNRGAPAARGWGIPIATDIAFSVGVLMLLGDRVPASARAFLLALAVFDDIGAILVIASCYTQGLSPQALAVAAALLGVLLAMRAAGVSGSGAYLVPSLLFWVAVYKSGVHATIAGVILGAITPMRPRFSLYNFVDSARHLTRRIRRALDVGNHERAEALLRQVEDLSRGTEPLLERRLRLVHPWSSFLVLPLFALANSDVALSGPAVARALASPVGWGVILGLVLGKPIGVLAACWLATRLRVGDLPEGSTWAHVAGVGLLAGIGFTVSLFVTELAFDDERLLAEAKFGILVASVVAGAGGYAFLRFRARPTGDSPEAGDAACELRSER